MQMSEEHVEAVEKAIADAEFLYAEYGDTAARLAEVAEYLRSQGWRTMESAPKDALSILLALPNGLVRVKAGFWRNSHQHWGWYASPGLKAERANQPTHWMPLPAAPGE